jgi:hypothetical protein
MHLWIDIDDTIFDFNKDLLKKLNKHYNKRFKIDEAVHFNFDELLFWTHIDELREIIYKNNLYKKWIIKNEVIETIHFLYKKWYKISFITSRFLFDDNSTEKHTIEWLSKYNLKFPVYFTRDKWSLCKELNITHFIDDSIKNLISIHNNDKEVKLFKIKQPWNWAAEQQRLIENNILSYNDLVILNSKKITLNTFDEILNYL